MLTEQYKIEITEFYYENVRSCSQLEYYTLTEARKKTEEFIRHLSNNTCIGYGVFNHDTILGFIWAYPYPFRKENRMYVNEIRIREDFRKNGLGSVLLKKVEEKAKKMGINTIYLHAEAYNAEAIKFYQFNGYSEERIQYSKKID